MLTDTGVAPGADIAAARLLLFIVLGIGMGPLLAYLVADPELSPQSILITASVIGRPEVTDMQAIMQYPELPGPRDRRTGKSSGP